MIHLQLLHQYNYNSDLEHWHEYELVVRAFWKQDDTVKPSTPCSSSLTFVKNFLFGNNFKFEKKSTKKRENFTQNPPHLYLHIYPAPIFNILPYLFYGLCVLSLPPCPYPSSTPHSNMGLQLNWTDAFVPVPKLCLVQLQVTVTRPGVKVFINQLWVRCDF